MNKEARFLKYSALATAACAPGSQAAVTIFTPNVTFDLNSEVLFLDIDGEITSVQSLDDEPEVPPGAEFLFVSGDIASIDPLDLIAVNPGFLLDEGNPFSGVFFDGLDENDFKIGQTFNNSDRVGLDGKDGKEAGFSPYAAISQNGGPDNEGIIGFAFIPEESDDLAFGWARFTGVGTDTVTLTQVGWDDLGPAHVTVIPEVSSNLTLLLLIGGSITTFRQRRKVA